jgi:hypothetical protein
MARINGWVQDASGSVADLGVLAPIAAALVIGNGFDAGTILVGVGALYLLAGLYFKVPVPVQPIKAAAAIAIARGLPPETLAVAGVLLGVVVLIVGATGMAKWLAQAFAEPIVRGLQLGVGLILMKTAFVLASPTGSAIPVAVAMTIAVVLVWAGRRTSPVPIALGIIAGGTLFALATTQSLPAVHLALWTPHLNAAVLDPTVLSSALVLLVIPQIPLTFGNAVIAVVDLEHRYFPIESRKVNARSISLSCGIANVATGALTGMPMCHGSGGLTAHYRAGARSYRMNLIIGGALLVLGLGFASTAFAWLTLIPAAVLAGFLAFTGLFHSSLAATLRGTDLAIAIAMGMLGLITTNLAFSLALGLALYWPLVLVTSRRGLEPAQS